MERAEADVQRLEMETEAEAVSQEQVRQSFISSMTRVLLLWRFYEVYQQMLLCDYQCVILHSMSFLQERAEMVASYQRLERVVIAHLQNIRRAIETEPPSNVA